MSKRNRGQGRPPGSQTKTRVQSIGELTRCTRCQSTRRSPYKGHPFVQSISGNRNGKPFNKMVRRVTQCLDCGQHRFDVTYEFEPGKEE